MYNRLAVEGLSMRLGSNHSIKLRIQITLAKALGDVRRDDKNRLQSVHVRTRSDELSRNYGADMKGKKNEGKGERQRQALINALSFATF